MKANKIGPVRRNKKTGLYDIDFQAAGKRVQRKNYPTREAAWDVVNTIKAAARAHRDGTALPPLPPVTLGESLEAAKKDKAISARALCIFKRFVSIVGDNVDIKNIDIDIWEYFLGKLGDLKASTKNTYLIDVCGILRKTAKELGVKKWRTPETPWRRGFEGRERVMHPDEIRNILDACYSFEEGRDIGDLLLLILLTGAREGEILKLKDRDVNWNWKCVTLQSKGGKPRIIPLSDYAYQILKERKPENPDNAFLQISKPGLYPALKKIGSLSGVPYGRDVDNGWVAYDFRHTAATEMESNSGVPYSAVSYILGHARRDMTAKYTHPRDKRKVQAIEFLEEYVHGFFTSNNLNTAQTGHM